MSNYIEGYKIEKEGVIYTRVSSHKQVLEGNELDSQYSSCRTFAKNKNIEILWASTREAYNYIQAKQLKCNIITMPPKVINQINSFGKSFKLLTIDTVKGFLKDSRKSKFRL